MWSDYEDNIVDEILSTSEKWDIIVENRNATDSMLEDIKKYLFKNNVKIIEETYEVLYCKDDLSVSKKWSKLIDDDKDHLLEGIRLEAYYCKELAKVISDTFEEFEEILL